MRVNGKMAEGLQEMQETQESVLESSHSESSLSARVADHRAYHEMADQTLVETDALTQFQSNIQVLADLTSRLRFLTREIRYVMKVD